MDIKTKKITKHWLNITGKVIKVPPFHFVSEKMNSLTHRSVSDEKSVLVHNFNI